MDLTTAPQFTTADARKADLKRQSVRGGFVTVASQSFNFILRTVSTVVLARLLTPDDFGLVAMVTAITGMAVIFQDMGLSLAAIQSKELTQSQSSSLFWINVAMGAIICALIVLIAPLIGYFYNDERVTAITMAMASTFVIEGLAVQHCALLKRQLRFSALAAVQACAVFLGVVLAISLAQSGLGYWAIVWMTIAISFINMAGIWIVCRWRPGAPGRLNDIKKMLVFGTNVTGFNVVNYFARNLDNMIIGKFCGGASLGVYSKAYQVVLLPISNLRMPLMTIAIPAMSKLQDDAVLYRAYCKKLLLALAFAGMPAVAFLYVCAEDVIHLMFGPKWLAMVPVFQILAIAAFLEPVTGMRGSVLVSLGKTRRYFWWGIGNAISVAISFIIGVRWGMIGVAVSYTVTRYILLWPGTYFCFKDTPVRVRDFFEAIWQAALASLIMAFALFFLERSFDLPPYQKILICVPMGLLIYTAVWLIFPEGLLRIREIAGYGRLILSNKRSQPVVDSPLKNVEFRDGSI